ncbi:MAG: Panacea domain-containing protein [Patescibacteria group bacterium]|jgi:hypothetical protein|nr:Panacea domain-containing protein [Patescibacteria group bacterium]
MVNKKLEKFKELLIFIVNNFNNDDLYQTKLWKLLYFCDADYFEKKRKTITGINYYKNSYGPTPDKIIINEALKEVGDYIKTQEIKKSDNKKAIIFKPIKECEFKYLSANEVEEARDICEKYYRLSVNEIVLLAHKDTPYLGASKKEKIDFKFVNYRDKENFEIEDTPLYKGKISDGAVKKLLSYVK